MNEQHPIIMIVDDDPIVRRLIGKIVTRAVPQCTIIEAEDGLQAGEQMSGVQPSLIFLDMHMPGVNGIEICDQIRKNPIMKDVNILMISADQEDSLRSRAIQAGADAFLIKPFTDSVLIKTVTDMLNRHLEGAS